MFLPVDYYNIPSSYAAKAFCHRFKLTGNLTRAKYHRGKGIILVYA